MLFVTNKKHGNVSGRERCPGRGKTFRKESFKSGFAAERCREAAKEFNWVARMCYLGEVIRGLQNLEAPLKGFNCCGAKLRLRCADSRFAEPRSSLQRRRFSYFSRVRKVPKVHQRFANLWTPGTIQIAGRYGVFAKMTGVHQVTGYAENCSFPGIAGNDLNRCEVRALQHKIRAEIKRTTVFFVDSRLRVVRMGGGGWKRVALDSK